MIRRVIALLVLIGDIAVALNVGHDSIAGLIVLIIAVFVGIAAAAMVLFDLPLGRRQPVQDSGFGMFEPVGRGIGYFGLLLFAAAPLFIAARGTWQGRMPAFGSNPDILFSQRPGSFVLMLLAWAAIGLGVLWLFFKVWRSQPAGGDSAG